MERAERKKRKSARRAARLRGAEKPSLRHRSSSFANIVDASHASATAMAGFTSSVAGILRNRTGTLSRRNTGRSGSRGDEEVGTSAGIEMETLRRSTQSPPSDTPADNSAIAAVPDPSDPDPDPAPVRGSTPAATGRVGFSTPPDSRNGAMQQSTNSETSSTSATPSLHPPRTFGQLVSFPTTWLQVYFRRLRRAHEDAARKAALEQVERRQQVFERRAETRQDAATLHAARVDAAAVEGDNLGWGLGSFGIKEHRESAKRLQAARERLQENRLLSTAGDETEGETTEAEIAEPEAGPSTRRVRYDTTPTREESEWEDMDEDTGTTSSGGDRNRERASAGRTSEAALGPALAGGGAVSPEEAEQGVAGDTGGRPTTQANKGSWSWWGPLKDWRLNDRSAF